MKNDTEIMTSATVWQDTLAYIQGKVPKQVYDTWFTPVHLERIEDSTAQLGVPNKFFGDWLSQHYGPLLAEAVSAARGGEETAITFVISHKQASRQWEYRCNESPKHWSAVETGNPAQPQVYIQEFRCRRR
jgi:chromosomal replication initiation ATPase DnaA